VTELKTQIQQVIRGSVNPRHIGKALDKKLRQLDG